MLRTMLIKLKTTDIILSLELLFSNRFSSELQYTFNDYVK